MSSVIPVLAILGLDGLVILVSLWPTWIWTSARARRISALLAFAMAAFVVTVAGTHKCNQGGPPLFLTCLCGALCATATVAIQRARWLVAVLVAAICTVGILTSSHLTDLYHHREYTGNPGYSCGRFWHTPFTGLYPRAPEHWHGEQVDAADSKAAADP